MYTNTVNINIVLYRKLIVESSGIFVVYSPISVTNSCCKSKGTILHNYLISQIWLGEIMF